MRVFALSLLFIAGACAAGTQCRPDEEVAFSCALGASRVVSLCRAKTDRGAPRLSYRMGRPGAPEFVFPRSPVDSAQKFRYAHYFRAQVDRTEITFDHQDAEYVVFDYYEGEETPTRLRGVRVTVRGVDHELRCRGPVVSHLAPLEAVVPCDTDNALSSCR